MMPERTPPRRRTFTHAYCPRPECGRLVALELPANSDAKFVGDDYSRVTYAHHHLPVPGDERHTRDIRTMPWCRGSGEVVVKQSGAKSEDQR